MTRTHTPLLRALASAALALLASTQAQAVVEAGHWSLTNGSAMDNTNLTITVDQTAAGDYTGTFLQHDAQAQTLQFVSMNVDEGSQLFLTQAGAALTNDSISALPLAAFMVSPTVVGSDFYLGARTRSMSDPGFSWSNPDFYVTFGWAHVQRDAQGNLHIVDSAMGFRESGIVVGTTQAVPEPSTWALMGLGLVGLGLAQRQSRRQGQG